MIFGSPRGLTWLRNRSRSQKSSLEVPESPPEGCWRALEATKECCGAAETSPGDFRDPRWPAAPPPWFPTPGPLHVHMYITCVCECIWLCFLMSPNSNFNNNEKIFLWTFVRSTEFLKLIPSTAAAHKGPGKTQVTFPRSADRFLLVGGGGDPADLLDVFVFLQGHKIENVEHV